MVTDKCDRICKWTQFMTYAVHTSSLNRIPAEMWNDFLLSFYFDTAERKWRGGDSGELVGGTQLRVRESESELRDAERRKAEFNWQTGGLIRGTEAVLIPFSRLLLWMCPSWGQLELDHTWSANRMVQTRRYLQPFHRCWFASSLTFVTFLDGLSCS